MRETEARELVARATAAGLVARVLKPNAWDGSPVAWSVAIDSDILRDGRSWYHTSAALVGHKIRELVSDGVGSADA